MKKWEKPILQKLALNDTEEVMGLTYNDPNCPAYVCSLCGATFNKTGYGILSGIGYQIFNMKANNRDGWRCSRSTCMSQTAGKHGKKGTIHDYIGICS